MPLAVEIVADERERLRGEIARLYPRCWQRINLRRAFMQDGLGIALDESVLPLSNIPGIVPPFLLAPRRVFALG